MSSIQERVVEALSKSKHPEFRIHDPLNPPKIDEIMGMHISECPRDNTLYISKKIIALLLKF
jgi:hypothetical protein